MTSALILLLVAQAAPSAQESPSPTPTPAPAVTILLAKPEGAPPPQGTSLSDVAKHIKLKLPANRPRVLTNESVKELAEGVELTTAAPVQGKPSGAAVGGGASEDAKKVRWQQRYRAAVQRVRSLEAEVKDLETRSAGLEAEFYAHDDPVYRDSTIKPNWDRALTSLQKARTDLEEARKQPDEVLNAARRDGALPGWFRGLDEATPPPAPQAAPPAPAGAAPVVQPSPRPTPTPRRTPKPLGPS